MVPEIVKSLDIDADKAVLAEGVQKLAIADIEALSIEDISSVNNRVLKDLLNDAVRGRLEGHLGGTYTSAPKMSLAEFSAQTGTH
jgi:hypothetical protein